MSQTVEARCHCGAIAIELRLPAKMCSHCHCSSCRAVHGAAFVTWTSFPNDQVRLVQGADMLRRYASSANVTRSFCGSCGTQMLFTSTELPSLSYVPRACISGDIGFAPERHVNVSEKVDWVEIGDALPKHDCFDATSVD